MPERDMLPLDADRLTRMADEVGTPLFVYVESIIRDRIRSLKTALEGLPYGMLYAMKANHALPVLELMRDEGLGIDAVSPGELLLALRAGFTPENIFYTANFMTDEEMHLAVEKGTVINVGETSRLERLGRAYPGHEVSVRINPAVGAGHHDHVVTGGDKSKFGIPVDQLDDVQRIAARHDLRIVGLHQHIGSGILETQKLHEAMEVIVRTASRLEQLRFVNVGGGLGVPYRPDESPLDLDRFRELIVEPLADFVDSHPSDDLEIWFEPGRFLVAECGVLLARVNTLKDNGHRVFAGVDSGMGHLIRPALYGAYHHIVNCSNPDGGQQTYDVCGNICESADFFGREREISEISEGDVLAMCGAGAYAMTMGTTYNLRPLPAELFVDSDGREHLVTKRESAADLIDRLAGTHS